MFVLSTILAITYAQECQDDEFFNGDACEHCHQSCLTCQGEADSCLECSNSYSRLINNKCQYCQSGAFNTVQDDLTCDTCYTEGCDGQFCWDQPEWTNENQVCLACQEGLILNLENYVCQEACEIPLILIEIPLLLNGVEKTYKYCRDSKIYVDKNSELPIELGNKEFPYKTPESAFLELFYYHSKHQLLMVAEDPIYILFKDTMIIQMTDLGYASVIISLGRKLIIDVDCDDCQTGIIDLEYPENYNFRLNSHAFSLVDQFEGYDFSQAVENEVLTQETVDIFNNSSQKGFICIIEQEVEFDHIEFLTPNGGAGDQYTFKVFHQLDKPLIINYSYFYQVGGIIKLTEPSNIYIHDCEIDISQQYLPIIVSPYLQCDNFSEIFDTHIEVMDSKIYGISHVEEGIFQILTSSNLLISGNEITAYSNEFQVKFNISLSRICFYPGSPSVDIQILDNIFTHEEHQDSKGFAFNVLEVEEFTIPIISHIENNIFTYVWLNETPVVNIIHTSNQSQIDAKNNIFHHLSTLGKQPVIYLDAKNSITDSDSLYTEIQGYDVVKYDEAQEIVITRVSIHNIHLDESILAESLIKISHDHEVIASYIEISNNSGHLQEVFHVDLYPARVEILNSVFKDNIIRGEIFFPYLILLEYPEMVLIKDCDFLRNKNSEDKSLAGKGYNIYVLQWQHNGLNGFIVESCNFKEIEIPVFGISQEGIVDTNESLQESSAIELNNLQVDGYYANWLAQDAKTNQIIQISDYDYIGHAHIEAKYCIFQNLHFEGFSYFFFVFFVAEEPVSFINCIWRDMYGLGFQTWGFQYPKTTVIFNSCEFTRLVNTNLMNLVQSLDMSQMFFNDCEFEENSSIGSGSLAYSISSSEDTSYHEFNSCKLKNNYYPYQLLLYSTRGVLQITETDFEENFGLRYGMIQIIGGEFNLDLCKFQENTGVYLTLFNIQNSQIQDNKITNSEIRGNVHLPDQQFVDDVLAGVKPLEYFSDRFLEFLQYEVNKILNYLEAQKFQILVFQSYLKLEITEIYQAVKFLSIVIQSKFDLEDCLIKDTTLEDLDYLVTLTQSHFGLKRTTISNIDTVSENNYEKVLIQVQQESELEIDNLIMQKTDLPFIGASDSHVILNNSNIGVIQNQFLSFWIQLSKSIFTSKFTTYYNIQCIVTQYLINAFDSQMYMENDTIQDLPHSGLKIDHSGLTAKNTNFLNLKNSSENKEAYGIFVLHKDTDPYEMIVEDSVFENCGSYSFSGGAIHSDNGHVKIYRTVFRNNIGNYGGAIYDSCELLDYGCKMDVIDCEFYNNIALYVGGAIYFDTKQVHEEGNMFQDNVAAYGHNIGSYPIYIDVVEEDGTIITTDFYEIDLEVVSGQGIKTGIKFGLYDQYDQLFELQQYKFGNVMPYNNELTNLVINGENMPTEAGYFYIEELLFIGVPGSQKNEFYIETNAIDPEIITRYYPNHQRLNTYHFIINFSPCQQGEQNIGNICTPCPQGKFSLIADTESCSECPENIECPGGPNLDVQIGYWRKDKDKPIVYQCLEINACPGGLPHEDGNPQKCNEGYYGVLCHECRFVSGDTYSRVGKHSCSKCSDYTTNLMQILLLAVAIIFAILILTKINLNKKQDSVTSILFRMFTNYIQILSSAASFNLAWPEMIQGYFDQVKYVGETSQAIVSFDCLLGETNPENIKSMYFLKELAVGLMPIGLLLGFYFILIFPQIRIKSWEYYKRTIIVVTVVIMFVIHPTLIEMTFSMFKCYELDGVNYLERDFNIICWSDEHLSWTLGLGIPMILLYCLGIPLIGFLILCKNQNKLDNEKFLGRYRMIYQGMRPKRYYWEFMNVIRKTWLIIINVFFSGLNDYSRALLALVALLILLRLQLKQKPYKINLFNQIQFREAIASLLTLYGGLFFVDNETPEFIKIMVLVFIVFINVWFFSIWFYTFISQPTVQKRCSFCSKYCRKYMVGNQKSLNDSVHTTMQSPATIVRSTDDSKEQEHKHNMGNHQLSSVTGKNQVHPYAKRSIRSKSSTAQARPDFQFNQDYSSNRLLLKNMDETDGWEQFYNSAMKGIDHEGHIKKKKRKSNKTPNKQMYEEYKNEDEIINDISSSSTDKKIEQIQDPQQSSFQHHGSIDTAVKKNNRQNSRPGTFQFSGIDKGFEDFETKGGSKVSKIKSKRRHKKSSMYTPHSPRKNRLSEGDKAE